MALKNLAEHSYNGTELKSVVTIEDPLFTSLLTEMSLYCPLLSNPRQWGKTFKHTDSKSEFSYAS